MDGYNKRNVIVEKAKKSRVTAIGEWIDSGAFYDGEKKNGIHHFLEHILFNVPKISRKFNELKRKGVMVNAFTSHEIMCFYAACIEENYEETLEFINSFFSERINLKEVINFENEKKIVLSEIAYQNSKVEHLKNLLINQMFCETQNKFSILGDKESIESITIDDLQQLYDEIIYNNKHFTTIVSNNENIGEIYDKSYDAQNVSKVEFKLNYNDVNMFKTDLYKEDDYCYYGLSIFFEKEFRKEGKIYSEFLKEKLLAEFREKRGIVYRIDMSSLNFYNGQVVFYIMKVKGSMVTHINETMKKIFLDVDKDRIYDLKDVERKLNVKSCIKNDNRLSEMLDIGYGNTILRNENEEYDFEKFIEYIKERGGKYYQRVIKV